VEYDHRKIPISTLFKYITPVLLSYPLSKRLQCGTLAEIRRHHTFKVPGGLGVNDEPFLSGKKNIRKRNIASAHLAQNKKQDVFNTSCSINIIKNFEFD
jgi:hypothetical protein